MNKHAARYSLLLALPVVAFSGCGMGKKVVSQLEFASESVNGIYYAGFDAKVSLNGQDLPYVRLPVLDPKNPARSFGYVDVGGDKLSVRVDVEMATKTEVLDGSLLPNGRPIPISLPSGVIPIALPVGGSNTKVYLAFGEKNIMAGVALTLKPTDNVGGTIGELMKFPANIFFPYKISESVKGSAGVFTGDYFGLGVFAVQTQTITGSTTKAFTITGKDVNAVKENFLTKEQSTTTTKMLRVQSGLKSVKKLKID